MMSSEIVANVENLSKCYYFCGTPWRRLEHAIFGNPKKGFREFWALRDVSFEVTKGETLGIVGENGSGKSTLLQILCGIISPTSGTLSVTGRVATILELGAGFNQEFTGKENIYMSATILGLSDKEVDEVYEDIAAFADIGDFLEQPVKTYSSGMCIRLAFSIAISVNAEILIIDEALAVGDMYFQTKCMNRLKFLIHSGVTLIFVSHDLAMMRAICDKCLFLEHGKMIAYGKASDVLNIYEEKIHLKMNKVFKNNLADNGEGLSKTENADYSQIPEKVLVSTNAEVDFIDGHKRYGEGGARVLDIKLIGSNGDVTNKLELRENFIIQVSVRFEKDFPSIAFGYVIKDLKGQKLLGTMNTFNKHYTNPVKSGETYILEMESSNPLAIGIYSIMVAIEHPVKPNEEHIFLDIVEGAQIFSSYFPKNPEEWFPNMVLTRSSFRHTKV